MRKILIITIFILSFSIFANAQGAVGYAFLEVVDSVQKPVTGAIVNIVGAEGGRKITNEKGQLDRGFPVGYGDEQTYGFSISKDGYYRFDDLGLFRSPFSQSRTYKLIIELLKIPTNNTERKILGDEQSKRELFWAVRNGKTDEVHRLLKTGINPYLSTDDLRGIPGPKGVSAIIYAAAQGDIETVKAFLTNGINLSRKNPATHELLPYYIAADPFYVNYPQTNVEKAERIAAYISGIDFLFRTGADSKSFDENGASLMTIAARKGDKRIIQKLLANGVSINSRNKNGTTALMELSRNPYQISPEQLELIEFFLKSGADPNLIAGDDSTYTESLCETALINAANGGNRNLLNLLLNYKADAKFKCKNGKNVLAAAFLNHSELTDLLINGGADVNSSGEYGATPLMLAVSRNAMPLVKVLLENGAQINATDSIERTALIYATQGVFNAPTYEMVDLLLKSGANPNAMSNNTHEYILCETPLIGAAKRGMIDIVRLLISYKADPNQTCLYGSPPTHSNPPIVEAARWGHFDAVKFLLENGADVSGKYGERAIYIVRNKLKEPNVENREVYEEIIKILEEAGAKE